MATAACHNSILKLVDHGESTMVRPFRRVNTSTNTSFSVGSHQWKRHVYLTDSQEFWKPFYINWHRLAQEYQYNSSTHKATVRWNGHCMVDSCRQFINRHYVRVRECSAITFINVMVKGQARKCRTDPLTGYSLGVEENIKCWEAARMYFNQLRYLKSQLAGTVITILPRAPWPSLGCKLYVWPAASTCEITPTRVLYWSECIDG